MTLGESTTAGGWSSCRQRCWASQLATLINEFQRVPVQLINMGIGANVISNKSLVYQYSSKPAANERLERHVLSHIANGNLLPPDLLVISYGLNDARGGTPIELFCEEMKEIIRRVREKIQPEKIQPLILILGPYYVTDYNLGPPQWHHGSLELFNQYEKSMEKLSQQCDCLFVKLLESYREADWMVHYDGCHANDLGHRIIANKIFEVLASNCSGLSLETKILEKSIPPWRDESTLQE